jgi:3-oxoacyl-[acyl-carrier protein] reductase
MLLKDKTAIIYGAAGAVGSAVAHAFAREGARLFLTGHHAGAVQDLADRISAATSADIHTAEIDALDPAAVDRHAREVVATSGRLDVSFNLVGWGPAQGAALVDISPDYFLGPIQTAMRAQFITATTAVRHMRDQGSGVILALTAQAAGSPTSTSADLESRARLWRRSAGSWPPKPGRMASGWFVSGPRARPTHRE